MEYVEQGTGRDTDGRDTDGRDTDVGGSAVPGTLVFATVAGDIDLLVDIGLGNILLHIVE